MLYFRATMLGRRLLLNINKNKNNININFTTKAIINKETIQGQNRLADKNEIVVVS